MFDSNCVLDDVILHPVWGCEAAQHDAEQQTSWLMLSTLQDCRCRGDEVGQLGPSGIRPCTFSGEGLCVDPLSVVRMVKVMYIRRFGIPLEDFKATIAALG